MTITNAEFWDFCIVQEIERAKTNSNVLTTELVGCVCANIVMVFAMS